MTKRNSKGPLTIGVEGRGDRAQFVIRIGVRTMIHAAEHSEHFEGLKVSDIQRFAAGVKNALENEDAVGETPVTNAFDGAFLKAIEGDCGVEAAVSSEVSK